MKRLIRSILFLLLITIGALLVYNIFNINADIKFLETSTMRTISWAFLLVSMAAILFYISRKEKFFSQIKVLFPNAEEQKKLKNRYREGLTEQIQDVIALLLCTVYFHIIDLISSFDFSNIKWDFVFEKTDIIAVSKLTFFFIALFAVLDSLYCQIVMITLVKYEVD